MQHNTKMISFSAASLLEETGNISIESLKKKKSFAQRTERRRKKNYPSWVITAKGSIYNFLSLLSPWVMDLTGVGVSWVSSLGLLNCLAVGGAHQPADKVLSFPKHRNRNFRNKTWPVILKGDTLISRDWDLQVGGDLLSFTAPGKLGVCWIRQEWVRRSLLDIHWICSWSSYCKALLEAWREGM